MKSQTPNLLEWVTLKPLETVPRVIAVATILAAFITPSPAIIVHTLNGAAVEVRYFSGTVTHVDQRRRTFALKWQGKGLTKMEYYHPSFEETPMENATRGRFAGILKDVGYFLRRGPARISRGSRLLLRTLN